MLQRTFGKSIALMGVVCLLSIALVPGTGFAATPKQGGTLVMVPKKEASILVAATTAADPTILISTKIHDGLLKLDLDNKLQPVLATSWDVSEDGKTVTLKLRKDVKWHDGKAFTSKDVAFSIMTLKKYHPRGRATFGHVAEVDTPDEFTAVLKLDKASPYMMIALCGAESPMLPEHIYAGSDILTNPAINNPIGCGPFKFVEWKKGSHVTLERNPDYWDAQKPYLDRIIFKFIPDPASRAVAFETKEVDLGGNNVVPLLDVKRLSQISYIGTESRGYTAVASVHRIEFNLKNKYFKNLKVRQAVAHAVDKDFIQKNIWFGYGFVTDSPLHPYLKTFYTNDVPKYEYDLKKAEQLLDEAGFKRGADGVRFRVTHDPLPIGTTFNATGEYLKAVLKKIGIEVTIRSQDLPAYLKRVYTDRDFDFINNGMNSGPDPTLGVQRLYWSENYKVGVPFSNGSGYSNPKMDELLMAGGEEPNVAKRIKIWHEIQKLAASDIPAIPILGQERVTLFNKKVKNHTYSSFGIYDNYAETWIDE